MTRCVRRGRPTSVKVASTWRNDVITEHMTSRTIMKTLNCLWRNDLLCYVTLALMNCRYELHCLCMPWILTDFRRRFVFDYICSIILSLLHFIDTFCNCCLLWGRLYRFAAIFVLLLARFRFLLSLALASFQGFSRYMQMGLVLSYVCRFGNPSLRVHVFQFVSVPFEKFLWFIVTVIAFWALCKSVILLCVSFTVCPYNLMLGLYSVFSRFCWQQLLHVPSYHGWKQVCRPNRQQL